MNKQRILVVSTMPFPSGNASVNRIITYSKGLSELGELVDVVTTFGGDSSWKQLDGFRYRSLAGAIRCGRIGKLLGLIAALFFLIKLVLNSKIKYRAIILVSNSLLVIYPLFIAAKIKKIKLLQEKSEFPFVLLNKSLISSLYSKFYIHTTYKLFDGLIIMTNPLRLFFSDKVRKGCKLFVMPMTVDMDRFDTIEKSEDKKYIAYCGDISGNKDGVENLIMSFDLIKDKFPDWHLLIIGGASPPEEEKIKNNAQRLNIKNLEFSGRVSRDTIPRLLINAQILVLARPSSLQSSGGFPTKLGEYLSTGNPVIVTRVGEIPMYLTDNETAYIVEPDNIELFSERIEYVINNIKDAKKVGIEGKKLAETVFNYKIQSSRLQIFINTEL